MPLPQYTDGPEPQYIDGPEPQYDAQAEWYRIYSLQTQQGVMPHPQNNITPQLPQGGPVWPPNQGGHPTAAQLIAAAPPLQDPANGREYTPPYSISSPEPQQDIEVQPQTAVLQHNAMPPPLPQPSNAAPAYSGAPTVPAMQTPQIRHLNRLNRRHDASRSNGHTTQEAPSASPEIRPAMEICPMPPMLNIINGPDPTSAIRLRLATPSRPGGRPALCLTSEQETDLYAQLRRMHNANELARFYRDGDIEGLGYPRPLSTPSNEWICLWTEVKLVWIAMKYCESASGSVRPLPDYEAASQNLRMVLHRFDEVAVRMDDALKDQDPDQYAFHQGCEQASYELQKCGDRLRELDLITGSDLMELNQKLKALIFEMKGDHWFFKTVNTVSLRLVIDE